MAFWEGHLVSTPHVDLLTRMERDHPETFDRVIFQSPDLRLFALNFLANVYTSLASKSMTTTNAGDIANFKGLLDDLELFKFDVKWIRERVDQIENVMYNVGPEVIGELDQLKQRVEEKELDLVVIKKKLAEKEKELVEVKSYFNAKMEEVRVVHGSLGERMLKVNLADGLLK